MKNRKGFSLIELLVVIGIIAILAAILFPMLTGLRERAKQVKCLQNLNQLGIAFQRYCDDNNGTTPFAGDQGSVNPNWAGCKAIGGPVIPQNGQLWPYTKSAGIYECPSDIGRAGPSIVVKPFHLSYVMNRDLGSGDGNKPIRLDNLNCKKVGRVCLFIQESRGKKGFNEGINDAVLYPIPGYDRDIGEKIHYSGTTIIYANLHAKWISFVDMKKERDDGYWLVTR